MRELVSIPVSLFAVNKETRPNQMREGEKPRAAAVMAQLGTDSKVQLPTQAHQFPAPAAGVRLSSTTSRWAKPCNNWTNSGTCSRGIGCLFAHAGVPVTGLRCFTCGRKNHLSKECTAPGGGADPNREAVWADHRKRKEAGSLSKGRSKGKDKGGKGKGGKVGNWACLSCCANVLCIQKYILQVRSSETW